MNSRGFTTKGELYHRLWLSSLLNLDYSTNGGIDLSDDRLAIELKCRYKKYNHQFTVHAYEVDRFSSQNQDKKLFWAFLLYGLNKDISKMGKQDIEKLISDRELWFLPWDWIRNFPISYPKTGPYIYIHKRDFPNSTYFDTVETEKNILYVPKKTKILEQRLTEK